jgi:hypothetical protein
MAPKPGAQEPPAVAVAANGGAAAAAGGEEEDPFAGLTGAVAVATTVTAPVGDIKWKFELGKVDKVSVDTSLFHFTVSSNSTSTNFSLQPGQHIYVK